MNLFYLRFRITVDLIFYWFFFFIHSEIKHVSFHVFGFGTYMNDFFV